MPVASQQALEQEEASRELMFQPSQSSGYHVFFFLPIFKSIPFVVSGAVHLPETSPFLGRATARK